MFDKEGLWKQLYKYKPQTTKADPNEKAYDNLLEQNFDCKEFNAVWLTDLTYIRVGGRWCYLAGVLDLARRKLVGWSIGEWHPALHV